MSLDNIRNGRVYATHMQTDILSFLCDQVRGKNLLDVGCADHDVDNPGMKDRWMHAHLVKAARSTLGLDILEQDCQKLRERGYNAVAGDACAIDLGQKFEVVVAGEIIEHVENPGALIRNLARHVAPGGKLILTTPHIHYSLHFVESILCDPYDRWHPQHVVAFEPFTLNNLMQRCGLTIEQCLYFTRSRKALALVKKGMPCWGWMASNLCVIARPSANG
jgi:2-polyprenyl-3-methyl-5-hydroxy-6-metoxy-1,4-benzoquinol methylase